MLGLIVTKFKLSPADFWNLTYREYVSLIRYIDPSLNSFNTEFFTEQEQQEIEEMKKRYG